VLMTHNRASEGLGVALPAGKVALFGRRGDRRILLGAGRIDDHAVGEKVEIPVATATGVRARQIHVDREYGIFELTLTNDLSRPQVVEVELPLEANVTVGKVIKRDGWVLWRVSVPANGTSKLVYRL